MAWEVVSTTTEQIVDTNPATWIESGLYDYNNGNFKEASYKFDKAIQYSSNSDDKDFYLTEAAIFFILSNYASNKTFNVNNVIRLIEGEYLISYFENDKNTPLLIKQLLNKDKYTWESYWKRLIVRKINNRDKSILNSFDENDWNTLGNIVDSGDVEWIIQKFTLAEFKNFIMNYNASKFLVEKERVKLNIAGIASYYGRLDILKYLYENKICNFDVNYCMIASIITKKYDCLVYTIEKGANINTRFSELSMQNALMYIAAGRHWDSIPRRMYSYILKNCSCNLNLQDSNGNTAPMLSIDHTWFWSAELDLLNDMLREGYVDCYIRNDEGENLYDICKRKGIKLS